MNLKLLFLSLLIVLAVTEAEPEVEVFTPDDPRIAEGEVQTEADPVILQEIKNADKIDLHHDHYNEYGFMLDATSDQQFIFAVDVDETIEARIVVHWEQDGVFVSSQRQEGEEVRVLVYEDANKLVGTWGFYYTTGISFHARKDHEYLMKIFTKNRTKLLIMDLQHITYKGSSEHVVNATDIHPHETRMKVLRQKLQVYMMKIEQNHILNNNVGKGVRKNMKRYIWYQLFQLLIIIAFAVTQAYLIRKLLTKGYSIV